MRYVAGVDGCPAGWVAAFLAEDLSVFTLRVVPRLAAVVDAAEAPAVIAVDMPIGLPDRVGPGGRAPERLVRPLLGARQSSVFSVPARAAVEASDYPAACAAALATSEPPRKVAKQCFHLFPKMLEVDALLRARPELIGRVYESHPELAFWRLNQESALPLPKKVKSRPNPPGLDYRRDLLRGAGLPPGLVEAPVPRGAGPDDVLDACAVAVTALRILRGQARSFPAPPERDEKGLPIAIWA